jgi:uncharacterized membrane protein
MTDFDFSVQIDAPIERVWSVLRDVKGWPELTSSVHSVEALDSDVLAVGSRFSIKQPRLRRAVWTVTELRERSYFCWESRSGGITTRGDHAVVEEDSGARLLLSIHQSGALAGLVSLVVGSTTRRYLSLEANGIKRRCEQPEAL